MRNRWTRIGLGALLVALAGARLVPLILRTRRDHDEWVVPVSVVVTVVLVGLLVWGYLGLFRRRSAAVRREQPGSWTAVVSRRRSTVVLVIDSTRVALIGLTGRVRAQHARADLVEAGPASVVYPLATRTGLRLRFADGDEWTLLGTRFGGFGTSRDLIQQALAHLHDRPPVTG